MSCHLDAMGWGNYANDHRDAILVPFCGSIAMCYWKSVMTEPRFD